ncbi:hypothetical protein CTI14_72065, partial [Methylobacterium radiotolerans]
MTLAILLSGQGGQHPAMFDLSGCFCGRSRACGPGPRMTLAILLSGQGGQHPAMFDLSGCFCG